VTKAPPTIRWGLIDRAVALISPQAASQRYAARIALGNLRRAYDGSAKGRGTDGWTTSGKAADSEIGMAAPVLRDRMRDLVRNNPMAAKAVSVLVNGLVGTGIRPRAVSADKALNKLVDDLWARWADQCDADGHTDFHGLLSLAMRETIEGGDVFALRIRRPRSTGLVVPLQIELKEADHLDAAKFEDRAGGARIRYGIEHDSAGRRAAYWMYPDHPGDAAPVFSRRFESVRIPGERVAHLFERQRVQSRGVPWGILARIMMVEHKSKMLLEAGKTMPAIAAQLGPGRTGNMNAVTPVSLRDVEASVAAGGSNSAAIEAGMLVDGLACQRFPQHRQHLGKGRRALHFAGADPVQVSKDPAVHLWIDIGDPSLNRIVRMHTGHSNLADAATVIVGSLDIQREKAERSRRKGRHIDLRDWRRLLRKLWGGASSNRTSPLELERTTPSASGMLNMSEFTYYRSRDNDEPLEG